MIPLDIQARRLAEIVLKDIAHQTLYFAFNFYVQQSRITIGNIYFYNNDIDRTGGIVDESKSTHVFKELFFLLNDVYQTLPSGSIGTLRFNLKEHTVIISYDSGGIDRKIFMYHKPPLTKKEKEDIDKLLEQW